MRAYLYKLDTSVKKRVLFLGVEWFREPLDKRVSMGVQVIPNRRGDKKVLMFLQISD